MNSNEILPNIRLRKIVLDNFRNIAHAEIEIPGGKMPEFLNGESSILGLYGQNGSGKTSLIMAISILKHILSGWGVPYSKFASCIRSGCNAAKLEFEFSAYNKKGLQFEIYYSFRIVLDESEDAYKTNVNSKKLILNALEFSHFDSNYANIETPGHISQKKLVICDEVLQFAGQSGDGRKINKQILIDTTEEACKASKKTFGNRRKYEQLTLNCDDNIDEYLYQAKIKAAIGSKSFIFSYGVLNALVKGSSKISYKLILKGLQQYGWQCLFTITMYETATNNTDVLLLALFYENEDFIPSGFQFVLKLGELNSVNKLIYPALKQAIGSVSNVISKIVPGLHVEFEEVGDSLSKDGEEQQLVNVVSVRNGVRIPFAYESEGIRRIVSFLSVMIAVYNNPSVTMAIDEIDAGIFEYMLGELLSIMHESAKGQLIFTSHNLRPLEVLPYNNLLFTTVNSQRRFTKLEGISGNNNLRDCYFRSIILGSGKDSFYDATDTFNIEQAFFEAGHLQVSNP